MKVSDAMESTTAQRWPRLRPRPPSKRLALALAAFVAVAAAAVWTAMSFGGGSARPEATAPVAAAPQAAAPLTARELVPLLTRRGVGPADTGIDLLYAPPLFFEALGAAVPAGNREQPSVIFVLDESIHEGELDDLTAVFMLGAGGEQIPPYEAEIVTDGLHHRSTRLFFPAPAGLDESGTAGTASALTLVVPMADGSVSRGNTFVWDLPLDFGGAAAAAAVEVDAAPVDISLSDMSRVLQRTRKGVESAGVGNIEVSVTYATPEYFATALPARDIDRYRPDRSIVFVLSESTHDRNLPDELMAPVLRLQGVDYGPGLVQKRVGSPHHRVTMVAYPADPALASDPGTMALLMPDGQSVEWRLPINYASAGSLSPFGVTWATILAMMAGMLAAMWPCLFQLTAFFIPTLAGVSTQQADGRVTLGGHLQVMKAALWFVLGFTLVYTAAGAMLGLLAGRIAGGGGFETFQRYFAIVGGVVILALALRVAAKARAPLVCKMPVLSGMSNKQGARPWELMLAGLAFATGCMTCFGAAMVITMVVYVGLNGSMLFGAMIMFLFSVGMGIPLVIAATAMARVLPLLFRLERLVPLMGMVSAALMAGFAILLITGNYMAITEWVYRITGSPLAQ